MFPGFGQPAQPFGDKPGHGIIVAFGQFHVRHAADLVNGGSAVHGELRFAHPVDILLLVVVFILDVSHDILHQVF